MVSAMVVFEDGVPNKKLYRKYKTKTVAHADERVETMEVIRRRYSRLLKEHEALPDLILNGWWRNSIECSQRSHRG